MEVLRRLRLSMKLDVDFVRQHFPAYSQPYSVSGHAFDAAAGSFPCQQTIDFED